MKRLLTLESMVSEFGSVSTSKSCNFNINNGMTIDPHQSCSDNEDDDDDEACSSSRMTINSRRPVIRKLELKRSITFLGIVAILIANIGGTGIFIAPSTILRLSGSPGMAIILWSLGGLIQVCLTFCVVELAQLFNRAGGPYYFINRTLGDLASFVFMWGYIIFIFAPSWALGAYTASLYLLSLIFTECPPSEGLIKLIAAWILITLTAINCTYMKIITTVQKFLTSCKIIALILIIIFGFMNIPTESGQDHISHFMDGTTTDSGKLALALFASYFGFGGWPIITILAEEVKLPEKNIPRALRFSFAVLLTTMVAANFSYYTVLSKEESLRSDAVAMLFGQALHPAVPAVIAILVCLCSIGTLNVLILDHTRMVFAAGRNGHMPKIMTMLHTKFHSPWPATFVLGFLGIIMLVFGSVMSLVMTISLYAGFMILMLMVCLFTLRWRHPGLPRPIKVPIIIPILVSVLTVSLVILSIIEMPRELGIVALIVFLGVPIYYVCVKMHVPEKLLKLIGMRKNKMEEFLNSENYLLLCIFEVFVFLCHEALTLSENRRQVDEVKEQVGSYNLLLTSNLSYLSLASNLLQFALTSNLPYLSLTNNLLNLSLTSNLSHILLSSNLSHLSLASNLTHLLPTSNLSDQ